MFNHLLESSHRDDSNKWANIGFGQEMTQVDWIEVISNATYLELWLTLSLHIKHLHELII